MEAAAIHQRVRESVRKYRIPTLYEVGEGICHQVLAEHGHLRPGELLVGTDSHTTTGGAFGVFATGIGATDMAVVLATGRLWFRVPESTRIEITGRLADKVMSKDIILPVLGQLGGGGGEYRSLEFLGEGVYRLSLDNSIFIFFFSKILQNIISLSRK